MMNSESFYGLCHGTDDTSAKKIIEEGFKPSSADNKWCGAGVYFYDVEAKAWWYADKTCKTIQKRDNLEEIPLPAVVRADVVNLNKKFIFDMRARGDMSQFKSEIDSMFGNNKHIEIDGCKDFEAIVLLRSALISTYAESKNKKLVIGTFKQREHKEDRQLIAFANGLNLVLGAETIYCVKDNDVISNRRLC